MIVFLFSTANQTNPDSQMSVKVGEDGTSSSREQVYTNALQSVKEVRRIISDKECCKRRTTSAPYTPNRSAKSVLDTRRKYSVMETNYVDPAHQPTSSCNYDNIKPSRTKEYTTAKAPYEQAAVFFCEIT